MKARSGTQSNNGVAVASSLFSSSPTTSQFPASNEALRWRHRWHRLLLSCRRSVWLRTLGFALLFLGVLFGLYLAFAFGLVRHVHFLRGGRCTLPAEAAMPKQRIAIVTLHESARFQRIGDLSTLNKERYAKVHNYTVFVDNHLIGTEPRRPSWLKVAAVRSHLADFDWVMWMDADALFMNFEPSARLEKVLDSRYDMIFTKDRNGINAGVWFARNTAWTHEFLQEWWDKTDWIRPPDSPRSPSGDQHALQELLRERGEDQDNEAGEEESTTNVGSRRRRRHVKYVPQCWFNSYPTFRGDLERVFMAGDLVVHVAGHGIKDKERIFTSFFEQRLYPHYNPFQGD